MSEQEPKSPKMYDPLKGTVYGNILDKFDNIGYNAKLYMIPPVIDESAMFAMARAGDKNFQSGLDARSNTSGGAGSSQQGGFMNNWYIAPPNQTVVLAQTGVTGNQIDNIQITSVIGPGGAFNTSTVTFDITQPGAANFIDQIIATKAAVGAEPFANDVPLFLEIVFKGYEQNLNDDGQDQLGNATTIAGPFRYRLTLATIDLEIDEKGSTYAIECVSEDGLAFRDQHFKLPATFTSTGKTIEEFTENLTTHLQDYAEEHHTEYSIRDEIEFDLSGLIGKRTDASGNEDKGLFIDDQNLSSNMDTRAEDINRIMNPELLNATPEEYEDILEENDKDEGGLDILVEEDRITFREGVTIENYFATILSMSPEFFSGLVRTDNADDPESEPELDRGRSFVRWFKINADIEYLGYDHNRNQYAKKITYRPVIYRTDGSQIQARANENVQLGKDEVQQRFDGMSIFKAYHYMYTGRNDQIRQCRIAYNCGHALLTAPAGGATGDFSTTQGSSMSTRAGINDDTTGQDQAQGQKNVEAAKNADALINKGSNDEIRNLGQTLGLTADEIAQAQSDRNSQSAQLLKTVLADQSVQDSIRAQNSARQRVVPSSNQTMLDGGEYQPLVSGYLYSADVLDAENVDENLAASLTLNNARQRIAEIRKNAKEGNKDKTDEVAEKTDQLEPAVQQIHVTNPAEAATFDGSPRNNIFGYIMQQHGASDFLVKLNMEIKGDPFYLGPPNSGYKEIRSTIESDSEITNPDYAVYDKDENYVMFEMQTPRLFDFDTTREDNNTGYWEPAGTSYFISGVYRMIQVVNNFSGGDFYQELDLNKLTPIKISMLEHTPPEVTTEE